ncbi:MAG: four-carbon acid sugar kinase family protein, partial [Bacillota bacterium]
MRKLVIIADDLTGANATGVLLARQGYRTTTFLRLEAYSEARHHQYSVIAINTDSRAIPSEEAYRRVANTTKAFIGSDVALFSKRIDSTMRGNIGAEI